MKSLIRNDIINEFEIFIMIHDAYFTGTFISIFIGAS